MQAHDWPSRQPCLLYAGSQVAASGLFRVNAGTFDRRTECSGQLAPMRRFIEERLKDDNHVPETISNVDGERFGQRLIGKQLKDPAP